MGSARAQRHEGDQNHTIPTQKETKCTSGVWGKKNEGVSRVPKGQGCVNRKGDILQNFWSAGGKVSGSPRCQCVERGLTERGVKGRCAYWRGKCLIVAIGRPLRKTKLGCQRRRPSAEGSGRRKQHAIRAAFHTASTQFGGEKILGENPKNHGALARAQAREIKQKQSTGGKTQGGQEGRG